MTPVLWTAIGMSVGAMVLHTGLALRRPFDRIYLSFACMMALVALFLYLQWEAYRTTSIDVVIEAKRTQVALVNVCFACMLVFVPAYSRVRVPRLLSAAFLAALAIFIAVDFVAPYGLWFSGPPQLVPSISRGEPYTTIIAPRMGPLQFSYALFFTSFLGMALVCAVKLYQRGERERGLTFALALIVVLADGIVDVIRDNVGGSWPYVAEYGVVTWGLVMSVQLARDFRAQTQTLAEAIAHVEAQARRLTAMLDALHGLEQNMIVPLDTLELGVTKLAAGSDVTDAQLRRVERAVARLREFARSTPELSAWRAGRVLPGSH